ncbi:hypothetical protein [Profundibacterium mesophilum]|uniref:Uncharacterized protein n=1 Tax=Profundibacterium mesophilum KAUST100406-0324 TaxID=1037889 RepID=A0A921NW40_9RHOB|nr:hypothetical protein [Profundibacterium mesophilum]KAF0676743.1 hypothetical protein PMES_00930 [Profundibacterium mesophilum KAUST100406-0324]
MSYLIKAVRGRFCRGGTCYDAVGTIVERDDFEPKEWEALEAEPLLHVAKAREEDLVRAGRSPDPEAAPQREALELKLDEAIRSLDAAGFGKDGRPALPALRKLLGDDGARINAAMRDRVFDRITAGGFTVPG